VREECRARDWHLATKAAGIITLVLTAGLGLVVFRTVVGPPPVLWTRSYTRVAWRFLSEHRKRVLSFLHLVLLISGPFVIPPAIGPLMKHFASAEIQSWQHWHIVELLIAGVVYVGALQLLLRIRRWNGEPMKVGS
jgi:hypothetical protein